MVYLIKPAREFYNSTTGGHLLTILVGLSLIGARACTCTNEFGFGSCAIISIVHVLILFAS